MLLYPSDNRPLRAIYAELSDKEEFEGLTVAQDRFVWLVGCRASHLANPKSEHFIADLQVRMRAAVELITKSGIVVTESDKNKWMNGQMSPDVRAAVEVIKTFDPEVRQRGATAIDAALNNLIKITQVDVGEYIDKLDKDGNKMLDATAMNSYAAAVDKVVDVLPKIIKMKEDNMGINDKISAELASGRNANEVFMERQRQKHKV